jgi:DNA-binding CsgD family transcriptional regulator
LCLHALTHDPKREPRPSILRDELGLSAREAAIAALASEGYSVLAIAHRLGIGESTVSTHMKRVYKKLGVRTRAELASRIVRAR